jgi:hypothetical protein
MRLYFCRLEYNYTLHHLMRSWSTAQLLSVCLSHLSNPTDQRPSSEANSSLVNLPPYHWEEFCFHVHRNSPLVSTMRQISLHASPLHVCKIIFNIIFSSKPVFFPPTYTSLRVLMTSYLKLVRRFFSPYD